MRLLAALVPPVAELDRARAVAAGVLPVPDPPTEPLPEGRHRSGSRRWLRRHPPPEEPEPVGPMLTLVPTAAMRLPIVKFGNLSTADATRLADELERSAPEWSSPRLRLSGAVALQPEGRTTVWTAVTGDLNDVRELIRGVAHVAQGMQMFVDRRIFRPELQIGTANEHTTAAYLEALLAELDAFESNAWWQSTLSLLVPTDEGPLPEPFKTFREISLGPAVGH